MRVVRRGAPLSPRDVGSLSYQPVGAALGPLPAGFAPLERSWPLPAGCYERAVAAVTSWEMHRRSGLRVAAEPLAPGSAVLQAVPFGPVELLAPCRVVAVVDSDRAGGFSYGTCAGHPEAGEESFVVHRDVHRLGDRVWLEIRSYSRLASAVARIGTPVSRWVQSRAVDRYAAALQALVA